VVFFCISFFFTAQQPQATYLASLPLLFFSFLINQHYCKIREIGRLKEAAHVTMYRIWQKKRWLPLGYTTTFEGQYDISSIQLSELIERCSAILSKDILRSATLVNLKGHDPGETPLLEQSHPPTNSDILTIAGDIATKEAPNDFLWEPFRISVTSEFDRFEGARDIIHSHTLSRSKSVPSWLPWKLLGTAAPIRPDYLRIGLDHYTSPFTLLRLGFIPTVTSSLRLEANESTLKCKLSFESRFKLHKIPLASIPTFRTIISAIDQISTISIIPDTAAPVGSSA
jgi:hypothetical protein